jgi:hypothetical protein
MAAPHLRTLVLLCALTALAGGFLRVPTARAEEAASSESRLAFHGYGEVHYSNPGPGSVSSSDPAQADVHRFVLGWTYEFTPNLRLDAEVDYEHAARELELEYAHLDFDLGPTLTARAGSLLMPVGPLNEFHEPPTYYSVERPYVQHYVIPTTWQEIGLGVVGRTAGGALAYRAYVVTGLDALGFTGSEGIRGGRTGSSEAKAEDLAGVARLEYATTFGLSVGGSGYFGGADHGEPGLGDVTVGIGEADARFRRGGWDLRGVWASVSVDAADSVRAGSGVAEEMLGYYGEVAYDFLRRDKSPERRRALWLFTRYERFPGRRVQTSGIAYMPIEKVSLKADFEQWSRSRWLNRFNLGVAFEF